MLFIKFDNILGACIGILASVLSYHYRNNFYEKLTSGYVQEVLLISDDLGKVKNELQQLQLEIKLERLNRNALDDSNKPQNKYKTEESWSSWAYRKSIAIFGYKTGTLKTN